jgi:hypothetical protein
VAVAALRGNQSELAFANEVDLEARRRRCWRSRVELVLAARMRATLEGFCSILRSFWECGALGESDEPVCLLTVAFKSTGDPRSLVE